MRNMKMPGENPELCGMMIQVDSLRACSYFMKGGAMQKASYEAGRTWFCDRSVGPLRSLFSLSGVSKTADGECL